MKWRFIVPIYIKICSKPSSIDVFLETLAETNCSVITKYRNWAAVIKAPLAESQAQRSAAPLPQFVMQRRRIDAQRLAVRCGYVDAERSRVWINGVYAGSHIKRGLELDWRERFVASNKGGTVEHQIFLFAACVPREAFGAVVTDESEDAVTHQAAEADEAFVDLFTCHAFDRVPHDCL